MICLIRKKEVAATPEELVRQSFLNYLIHTCSFPKSLICVELSLKEMPHLSTTPPEVTRRADILCYNQNHEPLLLVECKANSLNEKAHTQLVGYNHYVKARFCALVNQKSLHIISSQNEAVPTPFHYSAL